MNQPTTVRTRRSVRFGLYLAWLLSLGLHLTAQAQTGYIYVHKAATDENSSVEFPFTGSGGIPAFSLNDQPDNLNVVDLGAGENRLWAMTEVNQLMYRPLSSPAWTNSGAVNPTGVVDGGPGNSCLYKNTSQQIYYFDGTTHQQYSTAVGVLDVAFDKANSRLVYVSNTQQVFWKPVSTTGTGGWTLIPNVLALRIDATETAGAPLVVVGTDYNIYTINYSGTGTTNLGKPPVSFLPQTGDATTDITTDGNGTLYASLISHSAIGNRQEQAIFRYFGGSWTKESGLQINRVSGGTAGQIWGIHTQINAPRTIWTRLGNAGIWLDDERVRTSPTNSNSVMIPVAPGTYSLTEGAVLGWRLSAIAITDPSNNSSADLTSRTATVNVAAGEVVHLVFGNTIDQTTPWLMSVMGALWKPLAVAQAGWAVP